MGCVLCNALQKLDEHGKASCLLSDDDFMAELVQDIVSQHPDLAEMIVDLMQKR